ncbi:MAG: bifunctional (p)ppGpp synthetase/guanosine-3',5'-bis(diphosphate) 3'-pyrophosphohydrolase [Porticoccaceae bacterium]|nr:bifunctional (p)ppGpp synthetase/guanosine-3',5'-bis(diphosphate) 3'-pyrophosphohydrolase [Porticoccaceae bacterium]
MQALDLLNDKLSSYLEPAEVKKVLRAHKFAERSHDGQFRQSGDPYIVHPIAVAIILAEMHMDHESLMAAMLHDVIEDTGVTKTQLSWRFGKTVSELVDGVSKLSEIEFASKAEQQAENFQKMALAMARDIRVILVKLADRLHNMRTLGVLKPEKRRRIARETLEIYAPLAQRLGMNDIRIEFEDLGFAALYPLRHARITKALNKTRGHRNELVTEIKQVIEHQLADHAIEGIVSGREKHLWSIYQKMKTKQRSFKTITDVFAFRVVVNSVDNCYRTLGLLHNFYKPIPGEFKDYIAIPKSNGYQSLHTVLVGLDGVPIEVQIRTTEMDDLGNYGIASHWLYKSGLESAQGNERRANRWLKGLLEIQQQAGNSLEFIEHVKTDLFPDEVYVFSPKGEIIELPAGATAVDFAYAVHTQIGNTCVACEINGQLSPLSEVLQSGQRIRIITAPGAQPNPSWLNFVLSAKARSAIRHFLKTQQHDESVDLGKRLLDRALNSFGSTYKSIKKSQIKHLLKETGADTFESVLQQIGLGNRVAYAVANLLVPEKKRNVSPTNLHSPILVDNTDGLITSFARCCHPIPGDLILGHISPGRGLVVHRDTCKNLNEIKSNTEKCMPLSWSPAVNGEFPVELKLEVYSDRGIVATLAARITEQDATIDQINIKEQDAHSSIINLIIGVKDRIHLANIMRRFRGLKTVKAVYRLKN